MQAGSQCVSTHLVFLLWQTALWRLYLITISIPTSYLIDGYVKSGLHFSLDFFRGEVTGQQASTQDTVKPAAAAQPLHTLLKRTRNKQTEAFEAA